MIDDTELCTLSAIQHILADIGDFHLVAVIIGNLDESHLEHLQQIVLPVGRRQVLAHAEGLQLFIPMTHDIGRADTFDNLDNGGYTNGLFCPYGSTEGHLHITSAVEASGWILTDVTVAAVVVRLLAEIVEQDPPATDTRLSIFLHPFQLVHVDILLTTLSCKFSKLYNVCEGIEKDGISWCPITSGTSYLLIEALDAFGHVIMDHPTDIAFVDTHSEGDGGTDNSELVILKPFLRLIALKCRHTSMIWCSIDAFLLQVGCHLLRILPAQAVDDTSLHRTGLDEVDDKVHLLSSFITSFH